MGLGAGAVHPRIGEANPVAAAAEARKYAEIANRVQTLRAIRQARGLIQQQMSAQLDISRAEVSRMERRNNLDLATLPASSGLPAGDFG